MLWAMGKPLPDGVATAEATRMLWAMGKPLPDGVAMAEATIEMDERAAQGIIWDSDVTGCVHSIRSTV